MTCVDYDATERIIVKGDLKEIKSYSDTPSDVLAALINRINKDINFVIF